MHSETNSWETPTSCHSDTPQRLQMWISDPSVYTLSKKETVQRSDKKTQRGVKVCDLVWETKQQVVVLVHLNNLALLNTLHIEFQLNSICVSERERKNKKLSWSTQRAASVSFRRIRQSVLCYFPLPLFSPHVHHFKPNSPTNSLPLFLSPILFLSPSAQRVSSLYSSDWPCSDLDLVSCTHIYSHCGDVQLRQTVSFRSRLKLHLKWPLKIRLYFPARIISHLQENSNH